MKKFLAAALLTISMAPSAFASSASTQANDVDMSNYDPRTSQVLDLENGPIYSPTQQSSEFALHSSSVGDVIKRIIGDVIQSEVLDGSQGRGGYRQQVTCFAQNGRGEIFRAQGNRPRQVQARAIDKCYSYSRVCRPAGCQAGR